MASLVYASFKSPVRDAGTAIAVAAVNADFVIAARAICSPVVPRKTLTPGYWQTKTEGLNGASVCTGWALVGGLHLSLQLPRWFAGWSELLAKGLSVVNNLWLIILASCFSRASRSDQSSAQLCIW